MYYTGKPESEDHLLAQGDRIINVNPVFCSHSHCRALDEIFYGDAERGRMAEDVKADKGRT